MDNVHQDIKCVKISIEDKMYQENVIHLFNLLKMNPVILVILSRYFYKYVYIYIYSFCFHIYLLN